MRIIKKILELYVASFSLPLVSVPVILIKNNICVVLFRYLIKQLPPLFCLSSTPARNERQEKLCRDAENLFTFFSFLLRAPVNFPQCLNLVRRRHRNVSLYFFSHYDDKVFFIYLVEGGGRWGEPYHCSIVYTRNKVHSSMLENMFYSRQRQQ